MKKWERGTAHVMGEILTSIIPYPPQMIFML